jgi:hypothetical protein
MDNNSGRKFERVGYLALVITIATTLAACWIVRGYQVENDMLRERGSCERPVLPTPMRKTT